MVRGYGHVEAQEQLAEMGIYSNSVMQVNRVGLPRMYLVELARDLAKCPSLSTGRMIKGKKTYECDHSPTTESCRKYNFTFLHKQSSHPAEDGAMGAVWELSLWQDSALIIGYSNFFSGSRCGELARGTHGSKESNMVWAPEGIWHYNVQSRSATDGADELRKKLSLGARRIVRAGHKGVTFVLDVALTNAAIMWQFMQPKKQHLFTNVSASFRLSCTHQHDCHTCCAVHRSTFVSLGLTVF